MHQGARAHRARLDCGKQLAVFQTVVAKVGTGFAQGDNLAMSRRIRGGDVAVPSAPNNPAVAYYDRPHRDFSRFKRALGATQGFFHPNLVEDGLGPSVFGVAAPGSGYFL
jgi:hypothetical protein